MLSKVKQISYNGQFFLNLDDLIVDVNYYNHVIECFTRIIANLKPNKLVFLASG
jgi:hypothetical protein